MRVIFGGLNYFLGGYQEICIIFWVAEKINYRINS